MEAFYTGQEEGPGFVVLFRERGTRKGKESEDERARGEIVDSPRGLDIPLSVGLWAGRGAHPAPSLAENDMTFLFGIPRGHYSITGKVSC